MGLEFQAWITENVISDFQEDFVVDYLKDGYV